MKISATIVGHSINEFGNEIVTYEAVMPRFILAELNTHRMFSRNSASSRAIPFKKMLKMIETNPFIPMAWQEEHTGMQGSKYITNPEHIKTIETDWLEAKENAIYSAKRLANWGVSKEELNVPSVTKQLCNRLLEPFMYHKVLITATELENFFHLRCPSYVLPAATDKTFRSWKDLVKYAMNELKFNRDVIEGMEAMTTLERLQENKGQAEIHMMALAEAMWDAKNESTPKQLKAGEWHIPYADKINHETLFEEIGYEDPIAREELKVKIAVAMAARTSYTTVGDEKEISYSKLIEIHDRMISANPIHASPFEHCARAMNPDEFHENVNGHRSKDGSDDDAPYRMDLGGNGWCKNFRGFLQYRALIPNENKNI